jgi:beta-lactamase superfamily II metal-dependent hydrolase
MARTIDGRGVCRVHLLDVGAKEYGDALLCQFGSRRVLIDGGHPGDDVAQAGHPSIPQQIETLLGGTAPFDVDLLIVTHAHQDHIGCLPRMVERRVIRPKWALVSDPDLGWGRALGEDRDAAVTDDRVRRVVAGLRDECAPFDPAVSDARLAEFLDAAADLESTYRGMLSTLAARGTRVVRFGRDDTQALETEFRDVGLRVVGPSRDQVLECADLINRQMQDAIAHADAMFTADARLEAVDLYRRLVRRETDAAGRLDALDGSRPGPAVNLQSIVTLFEFQDQRFLFGGDMQFAKPQVSDDTIARAVRDLRRRLSDQAPYQMAKLSHHGSDNGFSEAILGELGATRLFGICAGTDSTQHPNPATLRLLDAHHDDIQWVRTDRNGRVTIAFAAGGPDIQLTRGRVNDPRPNTTDAPARPAGGVPAPLVPREPAERGEPAGATVRVTASERASDVVEVRARIPHLATRVTITVDVAPAAVSRRDVAPVVERPSRPRAVGGGRALPPLLFVTEPKTLAANIGASESDAVLAAIRSARLAVCDDVPARAPEAGAVVAAVRRALARNPGVKGVVILGGHDVIPHQQLDCVPADVRRQLRAADDPDRFVVWSDAVYGDVDGDGLPEIPVSRIPDGKSSALVAAALGAGPAAPRERAGVRNVARPFADTVFADLAGRSSMLISAPTVFDQSPAIGLIGDQLYLMLHGDYVDGTRFWGEGTPGQREAVNIGNLPPAVSGVVFTGCCWGALTTDTPAGLVQAGRQVGPKSAETSFALATLARGAQAFVGCTGAHYSPMDEPYEYFGGPMHRAFWRHYKGGAAPAQALFNAKIDYLAGMPHGRSSPAQVAIEFKILRQYTCLGLGW